MGWFAWRTIRLLLITGGILSLTGCFGLSQNPSKFPFFLPTGDIIPTHAKPHGFGYWSNFDPNAVNLIVRPLQKISPVRTQHVLIATVTDANGKPRRKRRVEWMVEGVGNIVEVDEAGYFPGRGYKMDNKYAVSYTNYTEHRVTRGNVDPKDDFMIRPGQTFCVITSAEEGDTNVTVYAPGIANWDKGRVYVNCRWVDATWAFPPPTSARTGTQQVLTTRVFRYSDKQPLANYKVRYRILEGPPALFVPNQTDEAVVVSDLKGNAQIAIAQVQPSLGINRVEVEIIRPPQTSGSGVGIVLAKGITTVEWLAPKVSLSVVGPPTAPIGEEIPYTINITNVGKIESQAMTVTNPIPAGYDYIRSQPDAFLDKGTLVWTLGPLPEGQAHTLQAVFRARQTGTFSNCAAVETIEGLKDEKCATTNVTEPRLAIEMAGPQTGVVGEQFTYQITIRNPGTSPAKNVVLQAKFTPGLEHLTGANPINLELGELAAGESRVVSLNLTPKQPGPQTTVVNGQADGGLTAQAQATIQISQPQMSIRINGPKKRYVGRPVEWNITVTNTGSAPIKNVLLRDPLPQQLIFDKATGNGIFKDGEVVWDLGNLAANESRTVQLTTRCGDQPAFVNHAVMATSGSGLKVEDQAGLEIRGVPALRIEAFDEGDPVEVGKQMKYQIEVTNTGSETINNVEIRAIIPQEMRPVGAKGPSQSNIKGQTILFDKVGSLDAGKTLRYTVEVEALQVGDVRFEMQLRAKSLRQAVIETESTTIISPQIASETGVRVGPPTRNTSNRDEGNSPDGGVPLLPPPALPNGK